jgi:threonine ammonia-lyase medium form
LKASVPQEVAHGISLDEIERARVQIAPYIHRTPLLRSTALGRATGTTLFLKAENLQKTGSFKPRGALNKVRHLPLAERERGLITISAGNFGQALAYAASMEGIPCVVVMPDYASPAKVEACRGYGAEVIVHGTVHQAFDRARELQESSGLTFVHPYDDPLIVTGHASLGLEILEALPDVGAIVVPVGGGGLISGIAAAVKLRGAAVRIIGVEPLGAPTLSVALEQGHPTRLASVDTIADGLTAPIAGEVTFTLVQRYVDEMVLVSDDGIREALRLVLERTKLLVEPAGAAGVAALIEERVQIAADVPVVAVLSGGNVDRGRLKELL